jgi:hypothetical protein
MKTTLKILSSALLLQSVVAMDDNFYRNQPRYENFYLNNSLNGHLEFDTALDLWNVKGPIMRTVAIGDQAVAIQEFLKIAKDEEETIEHQLCAASILNSQADPRKKGLYKETVLETYRRIAFNSQAEPADRENAKGLLFDNGTEEDKNAVLDICRKTALESQVEADRENAARFLFRHGTIEDKEFALNIYRSIATGSQVEADRENAARFLFRHGTIEDKEIALNIYRSIATGSQVEADRESAARFLFSSGTIKDKDFASPLLDARAATDEERFSEENGHDEESEFREAFKRGDIETLEKLKAEGRFSNLDDLGGWFFKYGSGMSKWDYLIQDALKNRK